MAIRAGRSALHLHALAFLILAASPCLQVQALVDHRKQISDWGRQPNFELQNMSSSQRDDIVVQRDLTGLWEVDLNGNVNGAVETCGESFHRFDKYLNFSNPNIAQNFDPNACGWAYGMNMFDLEEWKKKDITGIYHKWQNMNENRLLWKLGTLPPGLLTFYKLTHPLDKSWHVLGLGYNPTVERSEIDNAAVIHYNGNMKPWLEIAMTKYRPYWTKYINYEHPYIHGCKFSQ
ncbi:Polygalacturonate 4-alpha-galacturonosyltransferase [Zea mays]|uniref:Hexosyltransferase n=1 Tax=Zea mays TaxID=4577 RepID=A0A1D6GK95_MAIZE|nr:Polygalacturonate 4-alpha-galacturonosyltransferase [Zea mays]